jgi:hypothetical protein
MRAGGVDHRIGQVPLGFAGGFVPTQNRFSGLVRAADSSGSNFRGPIFWPRKFRPKKYLSNSAPKNEVDSLEVLSPLETGFSSFEKSEPRKPGAEIPLNLRREFPHCEKPP